MLLKNVDIKSILDKNRKVKALPKCFTLIVILHMTILFIPEVFWHSIGLDAFQYLNSFPQFVQYYVSNAYFHNSMFLFWVVSPFVLAINTLLIARTANIAVYSDYLKRRKKILQKQGKSRFFEFFVPCVILLSVYVWVTFIHLEEPSSWRNFVPTQNRFAMLLLHGSFISFVLPMVLTMFFTETRILLTNKERD